MHTKINQRTTMTNEQLFKHYHQSVKMAVGKFSARNSRYRKTTNVVKTTDLYADLLSQANLILWELILGKSVYQDVELLHINLVSSSIHKRLLVWKRASERLVRIPSRVLRGRYSYNKASRQLEHSKVLRDADISPSEVLEKLGHPIVPLLEERVRTALQLHYNKVEALTRKPYEQFIAHIFRFVSDNPISSDDIDLEINTGNPFIKNIKDALNTLLTEKERECFKLRIENYTHLDISTILHLSRVKVTRLLYSARGKLATYYNIESKNYE